MSSRSPASLVELARAQFRAKYFRYAAVSVVAVAFTQGTLVLCYSGFDWSGWASNVVAVSVGAVPSYVLNRYWVWSKHTRNVFWREVAPFWGMALIGLAFSTLLVYFADQWWETTYAASLANLFAFGCLWILKYLVLDQVLFRVDPDAEPDVVATPFI